MVLPIMLRSTTNGGTKSKMNTAVILFVILLTSVLGLMPHGVIDQLSLFNNRTKFALDDAQSMETTLLTSSAI